jgi:hypothetical protein
MAETVSAKLVTENSSDKVMTVEAASEQLTSSSTAAEISNVTSIPSAPQGTGNDDEALSSILLSFKANASSTPSTSSVPTEIENSEIPSTAMEISSSSTPATEMTLPPIPDITMPPPPSSLAGAEVLDEAEYNRRMTIEYLRQYFHLPLSEVAQLWGVSKPAFKKLCRQHGIKRWPSRQVSSIISSITMLQNFCQENELPEKILKEYEARLASLHANLENIMQVLSLPPFLCIFPLNSLQAPSLENTTPAPTTSTTHVAAGVTFGPSVAEAKEMTSVMNLETGEKIVGIELPTEVSVLQHSYEVPDQEINKKKRRRSSGGASRMNVHSPLDPHTGQRHISLPYLLPLTLP